MNKILSRAAVSLGVGSLLLGGVLVWKLTYKKPSYAEGTLEIEIVPLEKENTSSHVPFYKGDYLFDVLKREFEIEYKDSSYGAVLLSIGDIYTDFVHSYIALYVNDEYASTGISYIVPEDSMKVTLKETSL